eukprot:PhM_4_TR14572/c0_g2_i1/m.102746/K12828/SF3B1, SAP155; splicing factor 3B subunit 1
MSTSDDKRRSRQDPDTQSNAKRLKPTYGVTSEWGTEETNSKTNNGTTARVSGFDTPTAGGRQRYDDLSATGTGTRTNRWDDTAGGGGARRWDDVGGATPTATPKGWGQQTPTAHGAKWGDETPGTSRNPLMEATPGGFTRMGGLGTPTPMDSQFVYQSGHAHDGTALPPGASSAEEEAAAHRYYAEMFARNGPINDEEIAALIPEGYKLVPQPPTYHPQISPNSVRAALGAAPPPPTGSTRVDVGSLGQDMPELKDGDYKVFAVLAQYKDIADDKLSNSEEHREVLLLRLLLRVKNGTPSMRKTAMRHITEKAKWFREGIVLPCILNVLMSVLEEQERHLMVKVLNRVIYVLGKAVTPQIHRVLTIIEPMLMSDDMYEKTEAREVISNLAKATGLGAMVAAMRNDVEREDESVRTWTASAFAVVGQALGIGELLRFLEPLCRNARSWASRYTGVKIVQKIAELCGNGILPHLHRLVDIIVEGLDDPHPKMKTATALAISSLAEAAAPFGIEHFQQAAVRLYEGINRFHGKVLLGFLKAMGSLVTLMAPSDVNDCTQAIFAVLSKLFRSPEEEMKKIVLRVLKQCVTTPGVDGAFVLKTVLPEFMQVFWGRRMAATSRHYKVLIDTTVALAKKVGASEMLSRVVGDLRDDNEGFRRMVLETIDTIVKALGTDDVGAELEMDLMSNLLSVFRDQAEETDSVVKGFATVLNSLGSRCVLHLPQIIAVVKARLRNPNPRHRQYSADLIVMVSKTMKGDQHDSLLDLTKVLYEMLRSEEDPETLGSVLNALNAVMQAVGVERFDGTDRKVSSYVTVADIMTQLKHILSNRHEKVEEACVLLIGTIADKASEPISKADWNRICFQMLDLLKSHRKSVRKATVKMFGFIAMASDPVHVINTLLDNLKTQERQQRVCTTVALAVVAEMCEPYVVVPFLMNEYRTKDPNVKNGVLKALSFMFEYIGEMGAEYVYKIVPLLEDALMDSDRVRRQIACNVIRHIALGVRGKGYEDALLHLLNMVWPNLFESDPHGLNSVMEVIEAMRVALGPTVILQYTLQGLYHPARKVREVYWKVYNSTYMAAGDALVPAFPRLPADVRENSFDNFSEMSHMEFRRSLLDVVV